MSRKLGEIDYEIYVLAGVAKAATEAIVLSAQMDSEEFAVEYLRQKRETIKLLLSGDQRK